jgi:hypothetical protein
MTWIALLAALQDPPSRWDFKAGSWVEMSTRLLKVDRPMVRVFRQDAPGQETRPKPFADGLGEVSRKKEEWQGRPCEVIEYRDDTRTGILWLVDGVRIPARDMDLRALPSNAVRALRVERRRDRTYTSRVDVLELRAPIEAAGRRFDCVLESSTSTSEGPDSTVLRSKRRWLSAEVPGHVVRQDRQCTDNPWAYPHDYLVRDELTAFHVERP